jgi:predicted flap endonuclease-1-like 5' DNA nuclease
VPQVSVEQINDPAAGRIIADLRRRLDEVGVIADLSAARHAEAEALRRRLDAVLAARHSEVSALRRRITELEAKVLQGDGGASRSGSTAPHLPEPDGPPSPSYSEVAAGFRERLADRTAAIELRYEERLALLRQVLEEKDDQIRRLTERLAAALRSIVELREPPVPPPPDPHDLERIRGIGPMIAATLRSLGITTLHQIAALSDADLDRIDAHLDAFPGRARRDRWAEQAADLVG